jgi:cardiolipin synthase
MVVDGVVGFTGGVGLADEWAGDAQDPDHWRDNHYRLTGPAVLQMQAAFMDNWMKTHASVLHDETYFPPEPTTGTMKAQVFKSGAEAGSSSARLMYLLSIACARKSVLIANSYFVPDDLSVKTLVEAAQRGVKIEIITPGPHIDTKLTKYASKAEWGKLLEAGIKIYEYQPTMYHCKYMVIDGIWSSVGSTNFDSRSFRLNEEANLNVLDASFGKQQQQIFEADKKKSKLMTLEEWKKRSPYQKTMEWLASLLQSQV